MTYRVLQDLSLAMLGTSGIPQDTRLLFRTLSRMPSVELTGLLSEAGPGYSSALPIDTGPPRFNGHHLTLARYFAAFSGNSPTRSFPHSGSIGIKARHLASPLHRFRTMDAPSDLYGDVIWRLFFEKTLAPENRPKVLAQRFRVTNLNSFIVTRRLQLPSAFAPRLDTRGYDFLITSEPRPIAVSAGTIKLMRYHDPIPILHPDTMGHCHPVEAHYHMVNRALASGGYFVCNSLPTEHDLLKLFPAARGKTTTIPCVLPEIGASPLNGLALPQVAKTRLSTAALDPGTSPEQVLARAGLTKDTRFILGLSTLEPRKNFEGLIRAWELVKNRNARGLKLVIVGRPGWRYQRILAAIRPHMLTGDLLHLENLPSEEVRALYRSAACLVFPSFAEGFGFPPLEALQCGTPAVVSDIPTHRWVYGDAALYCDPYDVESIAARIEDLVVHESGRDLRAELLRRAAPVLGRYTADAATGQWEELLGRLKRGDAPRSEAA